MYVLIFAWVASQKTYAQYVSVGMRKIWLGNVCPVLATVDSVRIITKDYACHVEMDFIWVLKEIVLHVQLTV